MTRIHLEPLPFKTPVGAVLAFVCTAGKLDRKHVGKITFLGRGATVEVPHDKVAALVTALDGATFDARPVRARATGAAELSGHFAQLSALLDLEAEAEEEATRKAAQADTATRDGAALTGLILRDSEFGLGARLLLTFTRGLRNDTLPPNRLQPGSPVVISQTDTHRRRPTYRGVVYDRDFTSIGVAIEPPDDDPPDDATYRLDLSPDEVSRLRQQEALRRAATATSDRLAELRDVLLGDREPSFDPLPDLEIRTLNDSQAEAVRFALAAKDVAVIHGPPGTGKTTTIVELIRQAVARGERVLATAASNHAVDNLLEKLLAAGEMPVRIGHPARVDPTLRDRTLDLLVQKHADARQGRKLAKEAHALFRQADKWTKEKPQPGEKAALRREARSMLADARKFEAVAAERILDDARIVCGTLTGLTSDVLGSRRYHLAVIDEAGQATEPASWLPVLRAEKLVLAGDHRQLPATVVSPEAAEQGLSISLMERVTEHSEGRVSRLLTIQYRMHADIMGFSNTEFYGGALAADASVIGHRLCDLPGVTASPATDRPVRFIDTAGAGFDEEREEDSGSRHNPGEAERVVMVVRGWLAAGVPANVIGVITPYRAQVRKLRERLADVPMVEVDSVDGFQGREKEAIAISLVRSNPEGRIGFLADARRTNVALTRARRAVVMVGDSATLSHDSFYLRLIGHLDALGAYGTVWEEE
ncbi:MAG: AAA domain-containing protein [Fimbriiglobus sp.]|jgi:superfamily I DNA and/or RNA helicase|nr:AAA domain-containing protein [Fimbriiglobus sp.]